MPCHTAFVRSSYTIGHGCATYSISPPKRQRTNPRKTGISVAPTISRKAAGLSLFPWLALLTTTMARGGGGARRIKSVSDDDEMKDGGARAAWAPRGESLTMLRFYFQRRNTEVHGRKLRTHSQHTRVRVIINRRERERTHHTITILFDSYIYAQPSSEGSMKNKALPNLPIPIPIPLPRAVGGEGAPDFSRLCTYQYRHTAAE